MWLSLFLFLILLPIFAVACVYTAATRTRTLTNVSIVFLRALLRLQNVIGSDDGCSVEPCPGGIVLKDVAVPNKLLELKGGSVTVQSVFIKRLHLLWVTSSSPFTLCITGVAISVLQRRVAPKVQPNASPVQHHSGKLNALEALLWSGRSHTSISGWRWRQLQLLRFMIALALRNISVFIADAEFQYHQTGDPGPLLEPSECSAVDAVTVTIRTIEVSPKSNPSSDVPTGAGQPSPERSTNATGENSPVDPDAKTVASPPPEVRRWLYSWRDVSGLFPRIQALYNWFDRLIANYHPVEDCNAARICVAGVNVLLMSQLNSATDKTQQQEEQRQQTSSRLFGSKRPRGRTGISGRVSPVLTRVPVATTKGKFPGATPAVPEWAYLATVLRQWSMQVDVFLGSRPAQGSSRIRPAARLAQPLALHFKGTFGLRGQQRSADNFNLGGQDPARSNTGSFSGRMGGIGAQPSSSAQGMSRRIIQPSNLSRSSRTAATQPSPSLQPPPNCCTQAATTAQNSGGGAIGAGAGLVIHVDVILKALVLELGPEGVVQLLRMVDRVLTYEKYSVYWSRRPAVSVSQSPAAWWQHAGRAIVNDCREHFPLRNVRDMMARRAEYIRVYKELHSMQRGFCSVTYLPEYETSEKYSKIVSKLLAGAAMPDAARRSIGGASPRSPAGSAGFRQMPSVGGCFPNNLRIDAAPVLNTGHRQKFPMKAVPYPRARQEPSRCAQLETRLLQLESQLPLGQIMCNRTFVALWHSDWLARSHETKARWLEAMGVITNFVDAIPTMDEEEEESNNTVALGEDDTDVAQALQSVDPDSGRVHRASAATQISLAIDCPRLGLKLINKYCLPERSSTMVGLEGAKYKPAAPLEVAKVPADVLAIMLKGIHFFMPDIYRINLQAATVKASLLGGVSGGPKHVLIVPASHECADGHGTKLDFSTADRSHITESRATAESSFRGIGQSWASEGAIYADAPISRYLSQYKVHLAAVEVALSSPPFVVACARFLDTVMRLKAATQKAGDTTPYEWPSTNLHSLVMDSYTRNRIKVPSSMAAFMPKLEFFCPMVSARWMLAAAHTPSIGGISAQHSEVMAVAVVSNFRIVSRYVHTCYASLVQSTSVKAHVEVYFQIQPRSDSLLVTPGNVASGICTPELSHFAKLWLDADDVELAFPCPWPLVPQGVAHQQELSTKRYGRISSRASNGTVAASAATNVPTTLTGFSAATRAGRHCPQASLPFLPLLKIRSFSALALNQVPYEPAVPGTMTTHQTVAMHSAIAWFSPWHALALNAAIDSLLSHPVLANLRNQGEHSSDGGEAGAAPSGGLPLGNKPSPHHKLEAGSTAAGGSSISILLDIPLLMINCYAEMPKSFGTMDDLESKLQAMQGSGSALQLASWVVKCLATHEQEELNSGTDPLLRWGLRLTPLLTVNIANIRSGLRLTRRNSVMAKLQTTGLLVSDHQARLKRSLYAKVWQANSGKGSDGPAVNNVQGLMPEDNTSQLVGPLSTRAAALRNFVRDRRRAALCLPSYLAPHGEKRGQVRQQWLRLLEIQLLHRASDFAMFLLSPTHRSVAQCFGALPQPLESYRLLFQESIKCAPPRYTCSPAVLVTPLEPVLVTPHLSSDADYNAHTRNQSETPAQRSLVHFRNVSALGSIAALFSPGASRANYGATPNHKSVTLAQMLGAVHSQSFRHVATLRHSVTVLSGHGSVTDSSPRASREGGAFARSSVGCILEEANTSTSSVLPGTKEPGSGSSQHTMCSDAPAAASRSLPVPRASCSGRPVPIMESESVRSRPSGIMQPGDTAESDAPEAASSLHSAFTTAQEQSTAAAQDSSPGSQPSVSASTESGTKLSFVQAFRYLGVGLVRQKRLAYVYNMPLPTPVLVIVMMQRLANHKTTAISAGCQQVISSVGVHSVGAILRMLVQTEQAIRSSVRASKEPMGTTPASQMNASSSPAPNGYTVNVSVHVLRVKVIIEEPPRRQLPPRPLSSIPESDLPQHGREQRTLDPVSKRKREPGLTELTLIQVRELAVELLPDHQPGPPTGLKVRAEIQDITVLDLQGCVEHRNVLIGKTEQLRDCVSQTRKHPGQVTLEYCIPSKPDVPGVFRVVMFDLYITWLRRYSNNLLYAIGIMTAAYRSAIHEGTPVNAATASSPTQPLYERTTESSLSATSTSRTASPLLLIEAKNLKVVLPGGAAASHGPIRRAIHNEAISLESTYVAVCIPCDLVALRDAKLVDFERLHGVPAWMTSPEEVYGLISSSLRLGDKHFPQINQQVMPDDRVRPRGSGDEHGEGSVIARRHQPPAAAKTSSPSKRLQRRLQAAKATLINPLKEILHEAGHKRAEQRGELGVVLIDENATCQTSELNPGYLSIDDAESRPKGTAAAPHHHTTTTLHAAASPQGASRPVEPEAGASAKRQLQGTTTILSSQPAGKIETDSSSTAGYGSQGASTPNLTDFSHEFQPLVLISVTGFIASSGKIVPYDNRAYERKQYMGETNETNNGAQNSVLPADLRYNAYDETPRPQRKLVECDPKVESALHLLADTELQSVHQLIDPVNLKGAVFHHMQHGAVQVHISALGPMVARLGPQCYERLMKVLTDNVTEAHSCFNVGAMMATNMAQRRTTFSPNAAFVPRPGHFPCFHLTVEWMEQFRAVLESDPAWWKPGTAPALGAEPCLEACFSKCSLGLIIMQQTHDMFLALYSRELHIADVRINEYDRMRYPLEGPHVDTLDVDPTIVHMRSDPARCHSTDGALSKSNATGSVYYDEENVGVWPLDCESTDTPDGQNVQPVVDDQLRHIFPGRPAVVTLLRSNLDLPTDESAHLTAGSTASGEPSGSGDCPHDSQHDCVRVSFAMLQDGTMANEIELCHTLVQWPYLTETSLVSSIIAIFMPMWGHPLSGPEALLRLSASPWFYFNLLLRNSQVYLPLLAPHLRRLTYGWRAAAAEAAGEGVHLTPEKLQQLFASMVDDDAVRCPSHNTASGTGEGLRPLCEDEQPLMVQPPDPFHSTGRLGVRNLKATGSLGDPAISSNFATLTMRQIPVVSISEEQPKRLEQMGVAITMAAFRLGRFSGGDGDSILKIDLRNSAGFVRHNNVQVTNWLLPIRSMALEHHCKMPIVEESQVLQKYIAAARKLLFQFRRVMRLKQATKTSSQQHTREIEAESQLVYKSFSASGNLPNEPAEGVGMPGLGINNGDDLASVRSRAAHSTGVTSALDLLVQQATLRATGLLELHKLPLPTSSAALVAVEKLISRRTAESKIVFELDTAVVRASFSNIPVWHALLDDIGIAMGLMKQNNGFFSTAPTTSELAQSQMFTSASEAAAEMRATWKFRPSYMSVDANVKSLGFVLCDDKPKSYGAPDVLTAAMEQIAILYSTARRYYDHMPEQSGCISLCLASQFLNNSTGRWEHLLEPWPAELHLSDPINPVFKSSRTKYIFVSSSELMKLTFHPSCLLTLGDTLSFVRRISDRQPVANAPVGLSRGGTAAPVAEDPPTVEEQMALSGSIMMRVPQRYLIQNLTGLMMSYWAPKSEDDVQPASIKRVLPSGCSEELQVTPTAKQVKIVGPGGVVVTRLQAQVIVLNFEGSWMPITDVSVDVVGKYCYDLHSPTDERRTPVIVDVALVGRTKILKIHSALFVQNGTSCRLGFRLHFPSILIARQVVQSAGDMYLPGEQDIRLRTLNPGEGRYLPVVAALGGTLYLEARAPNGKGWCKYQAAQHDVIRLSPSVNEMTSQAGFIATGPPVTGQIGLYGNAPLHFAVKVLVRTRTEYSYTTFHSMEVPGPGLFAKANRPLEASIKVCPTVVLANSLPYYMEGYLISLNGLGREFDTTYPAQKAGEAAPFNGRALTGAKSSISSSPPASESKRLMRIRRSETLADEVQGRVDEERIAAEFNSLIEMLKPKAAKEFQLQKVNGTDKMQSKKKKCHILAGLRCSLRWIVKRNSKEMELLLRTDTEPPDRITWQELDSFIEWAKQNIRLVHVPPGDTQQLYLDMRKQAVMCVQIPELHLQCTRPIEVNYSSSTASSDHEELPDFMRLDYTISGFIFSKVLADMESRNRAEQAKPLLQVVNQKFQDTAAASWDKVTTTVDRVANTVDKMANTVRDALDALSGPHHVKGAQPVLPAAPSVTSPLAHESVSYWHRNNDDRLVRLQLLVVRAVQRQGPNTVASTSPGSQETRVGGSSGCQEGRLLPTLLSSPVRLASTFLLDASTAAGVAAPSSTEKQIGGHYEAVVSNLARCASSAVAPAAAASGPKNIIDAADATPAPAGQEVASPASPITTAISEVEKASGSAPTFLHQPTVSVASAEQPVTSSTAVAVASSSTVVARSEATSFSLSLQPALSVIKVLNLLKGSLTGKPIGKNVQDALAASPADPPLVNEYVRVRLSYRPAETASSAVSTALRTSRGLHQNMDLSDIRPAESAGLASLPTSRQRSSCETPGPSVTNMAAMAFPVVRLHLHVVPTTPGSQEGVRVQFVVSSLPTEPRLIVPCAGMHLEVCNDGAAGAGTTASMFSQAAIRVPEQQSMAMHVVPQRVLYEGAKLSCLRTVDVSPSVTEGRQPSMSSPECLATNLNLLDVNCASPYTPEDSNATKGSATPRRNLSLTGSIGDPSEASPVNAVVHHTGPGSPIPIPDTSPPNWRSRQARRMVPRQPVSHMEAVSTRNVASVNTLVLGASSAGTSCISVATGPRDTEKMHQRASMDVTAQRADTLWSENAAFKYGSSVSTASIYQLPTRVQLGELQHLDGPSKALVDGDHTSESWAPGGMRHKAACDLQAPAPAAGLVVESDSSRPILHLGSQSATSEQLSSAQMLLESPPTKLSEGYVQLELFNAKAGSIPGCINRSGRRSATLSVSPSLCRGPSKSPRSAGSLGSSTKGSYKGGRRRGSAPLELALSLDEGSPAAQSPVQNIDASLEASPTGGLLKASSRNLSGRRGEGDLPAISEAANPDIVRDIDLVSSLKAAVSEDPSSGGQGLLDRRWTADDIGDNSTCYEDSGISSGATQAAKPCLPSPGGRKVHSDKRFGDRVYGWRFRHSRERVAGRQQQASLVGIGKRALVQPNYRTPVVREGRTAANPLVLAKSAMQVVPRLPSIARNMGGKIVDGGQQVIQGVPHVATMVADTIIAGGQGVKEKVVESTEQAIKIAKPKIKKGLMALAWKATEAMRKRKQGADGLAVYDNMKPSLKGKHKNCQEHAPKILMLSLHNSIATKEEEYVCRLTLYAPYWVDNRTGLNLIFKDLDAPAGLDNLPFLLWHPVRVPGDKNGHLSHQSSRERTSSGASTPQLDRQSVQARRDGYGFQGQKPALLNDQPRTRFCVEDHGHAKTGFCVAFTIATINQKYSVDIKGEKEKVSVSAQEKVNDADSPSTFSQRLSSHNGVTLQVSSTRDGVSQREFGQAAEADSWPQQQFSLPPSNTLSASHPCLQSGAELGPKPELVEVQNGRSSSLNGSAKPPAVVVPLTEENQAYSSSHAGDADAAAVAKDPITCPEPAGLGLAAIMGTGLLQHSTQGSDVNQKPTMSEITPAEEDEGKGLQVASNVSTMPLPDIPEDGALGAEIPYLLTPCASNKDTMGLEGRTSLRKSQGLTSSVTALGNRLSLACDNVEVDVKGYSNHWSVGHSVEHDHPGCKRSEQVYVRRLYQFAVEVWAAPSDTPFGRTKVITVKNKYLILNATGLLIEYKQKGTPDPSANPCQGKYGETRRFSRRLPNNSSASLHWDNADAEQELMIRPAADDWKWSGSFKLPEVEDYFGLRIRHRHRNEYVIIPVNITVGAAGSVLVTLNSKGSIPPYMIVNRCRDVIIRLKQADYCGSMNDTSNCNNQWEEWDEILPNTNPMPFAWDEPRFRHVVKVVAYIRRDAAAPSLDDAIDVDLDAVDANCSIYVQSRSARTLPLGTQAARAKFLTDNAKKVYVSVYADGPTRVLCFSEDRSGAANLDDEDSLLNLSYRLQRVASRLKDVDRRLLHQLGGALDFDIGVEQAAGQDGASSHQAAASGLLGDGTRRPNRGGISLGPPHGIGGGITAFRFGTTQVPVGISTGPTTSPPSQLGITGLGVPRSQASFAITHLPSRAGSASTPLVLQAPFRYTTAPIPALTNPQQRVQLGRTQLNQTHAAGLAWVAPGLPPSVDGLPPLLRSAPITEDMPSLSLEALPAFGGDIDIPIGGDLTVVLRSVEGLSTGLNSNEKVVAVEAKMAVVACTPGNGDAKASWAQLVDQPAAPSGLAPVNTSNVGRTGAVFGSGSGCVGNVAVLDHTQIFRDVAASSELRIDFYIAKGTEQSQVGSKVGQGAIHAAQSTRVQRTHAGASLYGQGHSSAAASSRNAADVSMAAHMHKLAVSGGQFAGCVRVPLMATLGRDKAQVWRLPLERKAGSQLVRGYVSLSFEWSMTNEGMLVHEIATLERILDEKLELLAQLKPLPISTTMSFVRDPAQQDGAGDHELGIAASGSSAPAANMAADSRSLSLGTGGAALSASRPLSSGKTAKALAESYFVNLEVSVLEISGLVPREGLRASIAASMYGRQTASTMSVAMLPRAVVVMTCGGETRKVPAPAHSINPRFPKNKITFENVPLGSKMELKVFDKVTRSYLKLLAEAEIHLSHIPGTDPIYAWLALARRAHGSRSQRVLALLMVMEEQGDAGVQLLMRIRINKPQVHGVGMAVTLDLAGVGLCAKTSLEELFNYTMQKMRATVVQTRSELQVSMVVQTIQLDNQMLEAKNPVVLSPADISGSSSLAQARRRHMAEFAKRFGRTNPVLRMGSQDSPSRDPLLTCQVIYNQAGSNHALTSTKGQEDSVGILAFRKVVLQLGPMDFSADQEFIEGVIAYLNGLPLEDFYQDRPWQLKIDAMQGGNMAPIGAAEDLIVRQEKSSEHVFAWLAAKEAKEFELLRGQSSMWFYLEEFYLSDVFINVTLALSSSFNTSGSAYSSTSEPGREDDRQRSMLRGFLSRVSGSNGFQLINVTNAPIQLEYVELKNHLVNRVSLINKLYRHYSWIALAQARKVLGGAGPAIAAIPASLLWASIALVDLGQDVAAKRVNPLVMPTRIGYVVFTVMGQVIGVLSRTMCALMGVMPPRFSTDNVNLSDSEMARRFGIKPQTAVDALYLGQRDVVLGLMSAAFGIMHDTAAGARWKGEFAMFGIPMGLIKASVGLGVRPAAGAIEATSKVLQGVGLACLGKRGIQGKLVRRVQAPGLAITDVVQAARASAAQAAMQGALIAAWQAALPAISSSLADDEVLDVVAARSSRVVLLTNKHLAYLYARRHAVPAPGSSSPTSQNATPGAFSVTYRVKWMIHNDHIDNIRGLDRGYAVSVEYHKPVKLGRLSLKLPLHRGMRTATAEGHKDLIFRLNRHIGRAANRGGFINPMAAVTADGGGCIDADVQQLRMMLPPIKDTEVHNVMHSQRGSW